MPRFFVRLIPKGRRTYLSYLFFRLLLGVPSVKLIPVALLLEVGIKDQISLFVYTFCFVHTVRIRPVEHVQ